MQNGSGKLPQNGSHSRQTLSGFINERDSVRYHCPNSNETSAGVVRVEVSLAFDWQASDMFNPRSIPFLPTAISELAIVNALTRSIAQIRFSRPAGSYSDLRKLYNCTFDLELAISRDFCVVPSGWIENHRIGFPPLFKLDDERKISARLKRMIHASGDEEAIAAILASASYVTSNTSDRTRKRRRLIISVNELANLLNNARQQNTQFVEGLLSGHLSQCIEIIAADRLGALRRDRAVELFLAMARLWGLHDLQIIAAKLHQSIYAPTSGLFEKVGAGFQSFQATMRDPKKMGEMAKIAFSLLPRKDGGDAISPTFEDQMRFWGFVHSGEFKAMARQLGLELGFTAAELDNVDNQTFNDVPKIAKVLRRFTAAANISRTEIVASLEMKWDDGAPTNKSKSNTRSVSHLSAAAIRYGLEAPAALAYAIIAFIDLSEQLPAMLQSCLLNEIPAAMPGIGSDIATGDNLVTFERMLAAYRVIFLRDPNYLRKEIAELMPPLTSPNIFASQRAIKAARHDFIMGVTATVGERLGETQPPSARDGIEPGFPTGYGADSLAKALAILKRDEKCGSYIPALSPAIAWRLAACPPGG